MRGALSLQAARAPYRRGGVAFASTTAIIVALVSLDGLGLSRLLADPVITVKLGQEDGSFVEEPRLADLSAEDLQAVIDAAPIVDVTASAELTEIDVEAALRGLVIGQPQLASRLDQLFAASDAWHADQRHIFDQGHQSLEALTTAWAGDRAAVIQYQADEIERNQAVADAQARIVELEGIVAAAKPSEQPAADVADPVEAAPTKAKSKSTKAAETAE